MGLLIIALIVVVVWIGVLVVVLAACTASGRADAEEERHLAQGREERKPIDRAGLEREAARLRIELPERPRLRLTRLVGTRRHRP